MTEINRIPTDQLPCKFEHTWWEDVVGDGGPRMQMGDCSCEDEAVGETDEPCGKTCPGFQPVIPAVCQKHQCEYLDMCGQCESESYEKMMREEEELFKKYPINLEVATPTPATKTGEK